MTQLVDVHPKSEWAKMKFEIGDNERVLDRDLNAALNIERQALSILGGSGFTDQVKSGHGQNVRPFGAVLDEASKMAEERRPSRLAISLA
jgi:hypothetical protein